MINLIRLDLYQRRPSILPVPDMFSGSTINLAAGHQAATEDSEDEVDDDINWRPPTEKIWYIFIKLGILIALAFDNNNRSNDLLKDCERISASVTVHRRESNPLLPAEGEETTLLPPIDSSVRTLHPSQRQRI